MSPVNVGAIGAYIREQREQAKISLRQLAQSAGISNPYLSQIERGPATAERRHPPADRQGPADLGRGPLRPGRFPGGPAAWLGGARGRADRSRADRAAEADAHRGLRVVPQGDGAWPGPTPASSMRRRDRPAAGRGRADLAGEPEPGRAGRPRAARDRPYAEPGGRRTRPTTEAAGDDEVMPRPRLSDDPGLTMTLMGPRRRADGPWQAPDAEDARSGRDDPSVPAACRDQVA